ncbi:uncharacterized protein LOC113872062 [Abrus precatorius]|uniref:Uncharacterized protein LOC113872062 n=1 Tax=Abrus precatorius TaxID=3816 RepID=A0A8B8M8S0_ABRPR|nr:uncharacterized protein LOC113872062 [Abrus precatorius]XP_027365086.1 uncharacterized protein LOC113872062 [Abrus precatorius]
MEKKRKIVQYRERLDRTLASPDLTNDEMLKKLVRSQLQPSSELNVEGYREKLAETKTAEISNFLDMLRSASSDDGGRSNTSHTDWKLKQDGEEFRVMYREGPEGTPFHTMLVEGFVDGPVDVCLCISWETSLYKKWWPQSTIPSFKILSAECLHQVQIGEQLSLVRVKVSWPLSTREAIVHYYLFEYFQDDLIVVLTNSVSESKSVTDTICGFDNEVIPEAKDVVRVDLVGGFALQKVTSERSYFRTIANMDVKLDFVPPSLINFISRQLIGNGFRLYQKTVASMMSHDKGEFTKALEDPIYARIREALYTTSRSKAMDVGELQQVARVLTSEDLVESKQDVSKEDKSNRHTNNVISMAMSTKALDNSKALSEIVEVDCEEIVQCEEENKEVNDIPNKEEENKEVNDIPNKEVDGSVLREKRSLHIRSEVEQALETLDKAISMVREHRYHPRVASSSIDSQESPCMEKEGRVDSHSAKLIQLSPKIEVNVEVPNRDTPEGTSHEALETNSGIQNLRYTETNSNLREVNSNKVVPTSSEKNLSRPIEATQVASHSLENGAVFDQTTIRNKQLNANLVQDVSSDYADKSSRKIKLNTIVTQGMTSKVPKKLTRQKKSLYWCFLR